MILGPESGTPVPLPTGPDVPAFWARGERQGACLVWTGYKDRPGYGIVSFPGIRRPFKAHRVAYALTYGQLGTRVCVCHHCDNRACIEPTHLFVGSHRDNMEDAFAKGRIARGRPRKPFCARGHLRQPGTRCCLVCQGVRIREWRLRETRVRQRSYVERRERYRDEIATKLPPTELALSSAVGARFARLVAQAFGLYGEERLGYSVVAEREHLSRQRIDQIVRATFKKLGLIAPTARGYCVSSDAGAY